MSKLYLSKTIRYGRLYAMKAFSTEKARDAYVREDGGENVHREASTVVLDSWDDFSRWCRCIVCPHGFEPKFSRPQRRSIAWSEGARGTADFIRHT